MVRAIVRWAGAAELRVAQAILVLVGAIVAAITQAVGIRISLISVRDGRAVVMAIWCPVTIGVGVGNAASAKTGFGLGRVLQTLIAAPFGLGHAAATCARLSLVRVGRAGIEAVGGAIAVLIEVRDTAAADAGLCLGRIVGTEVLANRRVGHPAAALTGLGLGRIARAKVTGIPVAVGVGVRLRWVPIRRAFVAGIAQAILIRIDL